MLTFNELARTPEYWLTEMQCNLYGLTLKYAMKQGWPTKYHKELATFLAISPSKAKAIIDGDFNGSFVEIIVYSLALGMAPILSYGGIDEYVTKHTTDEINYQGIAQTERGWQGHYIGQCRFHLNTLLELNGLKVVVSTVGAKETPYKLSKDGDFYATIGYNRFYETMAFESAYDSYDDANPSHQINFESDWSYPTESDTEPQVGHWVVVEEIKRKMANGVIQSQLSNIT